MPPNGSGHKDDHKDDSEKHRTSSFSTAGLDDGPFRLWKESCRLFQISLPSVLMQFALYFIFPLSASVVGRQLGPVALGGFSLGALVGNLTCLSIMEGSLFSADTLMPRAFGAHRYAEVGRLAIRATVVGFFLLSIPVLPLCLFSSRILQALGQDEEASSLAQSWIRMYFIGAAPNLIFRVFMRFLLSQNKPWMLVIASLIPTLVMHPFLLAYFVPRLGLEGSALSIALVQWATLLLLLALLWWRPVHKPETWPGISWKFLVGACELDGTWRYLRLALGGILSVNEWWFFEIMCFIAGSFGVESLDAHTIAYNLVPLLFMLPLGVGIGLSVRMGSVIGINPQKARLIAASCMAFIALIGAIIAVMLHFFRYEIIGSFTNDDTATELALGIWPTLSYYEFLIYIMGISAAILRALGMQWRAAAIISTALYCVTMPSVFYFAVFQHGGLLVQWKVLGVCYTFLQVVLAMGYVLLDWDKHAIKVRESIARMATGQMPDSSDLTAGESTPLLV